jgi:nucleoside-diphosphate kinase
VERTLVLLKPDAVARGRTGEILGRFEAKGLSIVGLKMIRVDREMAGRHYAEHQGKPFYGGLVDFITSGPLVAVCLEGKGAIAVVRKLVGVTNAADAQPGSIRGDLGMSNRFNLVHASDSPATAAREVVAFFNDQELMSVDTGALRWVYDLADGDPL